MESFVCPACGSVVSAERREAHETTWCSALPASDEEEEEEKEKARKEASCRGMGGARATLSPLCQDLVLASFGSRPGLLFELEQRDIFGPLDTGAALWYADRVMSEFLCSSEVPGGGGGGGGSGSEQRGLALVIGSGGVPLSGLVACALGWDVVCTDLEPVLELTRANVARNMAAMEAARNISGHGPTSFLVREVYFGDEEALAEALAGLRGRPLLLLCSDCIWREFLHRPMLATVASALRRGEEGGGEASALLCFQRRSPQNEGMFMQILSEEFTCFDVAHIDVSGALAKVQWPVQIAKGVADLGTDSFPLLRLTLRPGAAIPDPVAAVPAPDQRKPWW